MTPIVKWVRDRVEKWLGSFYEGPDPPKRLGEQVVAFANLRPLATRGDWIDFATNLAEECYRAGYLRGVEYTERDPEEPGGITPEEIADQIDPDWRWRPMIEVEFPREEVIPERREDHEVIQAQLEFIARKGRRF